MDFTNGNFLKLAVGPHLTIERRHLMWWTGLKEPGSYVKIDHIFKIDFKA